MANQLRLIRRNREKQDRVIRLLDERQALEDWRTDIDVDRQPRPPGTPSHPADPPPGTDEDERNIFERGLGPLGFLPSLVESVEEDIERGGFSKDVAEFAGGAFKGLDIVTEFGIRAIRQTDPTRADPAARRRFEEEVPEARPRSPFVGREELAESFAERPIGEQLFTGALIAPETAGLAASRLARAGRGATEAVEQARPAAKAVQSVDEATEDLRDIPDLVEGMRTNARGAMRKKLENFKVKASEAARAQQYISQSPLQQRSAADRLEIERFYRESPINEVDPRRTRSIASNIERATNPPPEFVDEVQNLYAADVPLKTRAIDDLVTKADEVREAEVLRVGSTAWARVMRLTRPLRKMTTISSVVDFPVSGVRATLRRAEFLNTRRDLEGLAHDKILADEQLWFPAADTSKWPQPRTKGVRQFFNQHIAPSKDTAEGQLLWKMHAALNPRSYNFSKDTHGRMQRTFVNLLQKILNEEFELAKFKGVRFNGVQERYLPHLWDLTPEELGKLDDPVLQGRARFLLGGRQRSQNDRVFGSLEEGVNKGFRFRPELRNLADLVSARMAETSRQIADADFKAAIKDLPDDMQRQLRDRFEQRLPPLAEAAGKLTMAMRSMLLTLDLAVFQVQSPAHVVNLVKDPAQFFKSWITGLHTLMSPDAFRAWSWMHYNDLVRAHNAGLELGIRSLEEVTGKGRGINRGLLTDSLHTNPYIPLEVAASARNIEEAIRRVPRAAAAINEAQFGRYLTVLKHTTFKNLTEFYSKETMMGKILKGLDDTWEGLPHDEAERVAAKATNEIFASLNQAIHMQTPLQRVIEQTVFALTPQFTKSMLITMGRALASRSPEAIYARKYLLTLLGITLGAAELVTYTRTGQHVEINPREGAFGFALTEKGPFNFLGRWRGLIKTLANPDDPEQMERWARGRWALIPSTVLEQIQQRDIYTGEPLITEESLAGQMRQRAEHLASQLTPLAAQQIGELEEAGDVDIGRAVFAATGGSQFTFSEERRAIVDRLAELATEQGADPQRVQRLQLTTGKVLDVRDDEGRRFFTREQQRQMVRQTAEELGIEEDEVRKLGEEEFFERTAAEKEVRLDNRIDTFFNKVKTRREEREEISESLGALASRGEITWAEARDRLQALRRKHRASRLDDDTEFEDVVAELDRLRKEGIEDENLKQIVFDDISAQFFRDELFDKLGNRDFEKTDIVEEAVRDYYGDALVDEYFEQFEARKPQWVQEMDHAANETLQPYWEVPEQLFGTQGSELLDEYYALDRNQRQFFLLQNPQLRPMINLVDKQRALMRLTNPEIDEALVKWYGYVPIANALTDTPTLPSQIP